MPSNTSDLLGTIPPLGSPTYADPMQSTRWKSMVLYPDTKDDSEPEDKILTLSFERNEGTMNKICSHALCVIKYPVFVSNCIISI